MYGEHDWMDVEGGYASEEKLKEAQKAALASASPAERARENGSVKVSIIRQAGHHVYLDGWEQFNQEIDQEMRDVEKRQKRLREVEEKEARSG
jgi:cardiolipin-specific phospholipase